ncbi:MAG: 50S ribosomal protein L29 [Eubacterium sp.]|nr:50S ribosomal protein L29 [Eubacterium sp.]MCD8158390.1 50S ribosomal protein L29 [Clostridiales bacterium]
MKIKDYLAELNDKTVDELKTALVDAKKELFNLRFQNATNQLNNTARISRVKKDIARIQTVLTQKAGA